MPPSQKRLVPFAVAALAFAGCGANPSASPVTPGAAVETSAVAVRTNSTATKRSVRHATALESTLYNFLGVPDGGEPDSALVADSAGNFYGTTFLGGDSSCGGGDYPGCGTVYKLTPSPSGGYSESVIWSFDGTAGALPVSVIVDAAGNLYGVTQSTAQPNDNLGTVFKLTPGPSGYSFTLLHSFAGGSDGATPAGTLALDKSGDIYGTTELGGNGQCVGFENAPGCGTAFELRASGSTYTYKQLHAFQGGSDGAFPTGPILVQPGGLVIGTAGGLLNNDPSDAQSVVFELTSQNNNWFNKIQYTFTRGVAVPLGGVIADKNGNLFGTASLGGARADLGGVFELSPYKNTYKLSVLYTFKSPAKTGAGPISGLTEDAQGDLYGTTPAYRQEQYSGGTVFELSPQGKKYTYTQLYDFSSQINGQSPNAVTLGPAGVLYGTTVNGGSTYGNSLGGYGVLFSITP